MTNEWKPYLKKKGIGLQLGVDETFEQRIERKQQEYRELSKVVRNSFGQNWPQYNKAQTREKLVFYRLLDELLEVIPERIYTFGRPRKSLRDMIFCCMLKTYCNVSGRRIISDLKLAREAGYIKETPHFNTVLNYFDDEAVNIVLHYLIGISALPLASVEEHFSIDSSGFGTKRFDHWAEEKYGKGTSMSKFRKCHIKSGAITNIVVAARTTRSNVSDTTVFAELLRDNAHHFNQKEISADKAYSSRENLKLAEELGAMPYIPFKKNATGRPKGKGFIWRKMYEMFVNDYYNFATHYHKRSNVESTFAMIKRKFGDFCRCKGEKSQDNEMLCKILANNIVILIHEMLNLGIEVDFLAQARKIPAHKVI